MKHFLFIIGIFCLTLAGCQSPRHAPPKAEKGVIDLSNWDFDKDGTIVLDGNWEFYPGHLYTPEDFKKNDTQAGLTYFVVPGFWEMSHQRPGYGYATYRLKIKGRFPRLMASFVLDPSSAYKFWVNDQLIAGAGKVATNGTDEVPQLLPQVGIFESSQGEMQMIVQVSNFFHYRGGIWKSPTLGTKEAVLHQRDVSSITNMFLVGVFAILSIYQLFIFFLRRTEYTVFWFGLFCLLVALRLMVTQDRLLYVLFPNMSLNLGYRLEYESAFGGVILWGLFLQNLFYKEFPVKVIRVFVVAGIIETIIIFTTTTYFYSSILVAFQMVSVVIILYYLYVVVLSYIHKRRTSGFLLFSLLVVIAAVVNDILYTRLIINTALVIPYAAFLFVLVQAYLIARRIAKAYNVVEKLSVELNVANVTLEQKVIERTQELEKEKKKADDLLLNILPTEVAEELKTKGRSKARTYENVTVLFTDMVDFTQISEHLGPELLVAEIDHCFSAFDKIIEELGIEKIKTIGDAYMCAAGVPIANEAHAELVVTAALRIREFMENRTKEKQMLNEIPFQIRVGIHSGAVVAGIVGVRKFAYDIWGDTVNTAARMEQYSEAGKINISDATYELVKGKFNCTYRGKIEAKHKGMRDMYYVES